MSGNVRGQYLVLILACGQHKYFAVGLYPPCLPHKATALSRYQLAVATLCQSRDCYRKQQLDIMPGRCLVFVVATVAAFAQGKNSAIYGRPM